MSPIEITSNRTSGSGTWPSENAGGQTQLNTVLFWVLLTLIALSPLPFGSVQAFFGGFWALYVGIAGAIYLMALSRVRQSFRVPLPAINLPFMMFGLTCAYLVVQLLPLGNVIGRIPILAAAGMEFSAPQISIAPNMTILMLMRQLTYGLFFFLMLQVTANDRRRGLLFDALLLVIVAYGLYAMISLQSGDTILGMKKWAYIGSATGPFVNRNSFATFLALGTVVAAGQIGSHIVRRFERHPDDGRNRNNTSNIVLYTLAYGFLLAVLVATQSRMGLLAALTGGIVVCILTIHAGRSLDKLVYILPLALAIIAAAMVLFGQGLFERLGSLEASTEVRGDLYRQVIELIGLRPWTGFGGGSFGLAFPLVHDQPVSPDYFWERAHNTYLSLWAELGLVFGSLPVLALAIVAYRLLSAIVRRKGSWTAPTIALAAIAVGGVHSLVDFSLEIQANTFMFLALVAAGTTASVSRQQS